MKNMAMHILDLTGNSISAGANLIKVYITEDYYTNIFTITVTDNGCGIDEKDLYNAFNPFYTTKNKETGLGLSLFKNSCEKSGGSVKIESVKNKGTRVTGTLDTANVNCISEGNIINTLATIAVTNPQADFIFKIHRDDYKSMLDTRIFKKRENIEFLSIGNYSKLLNEL